MNQPLITPVSSALSILADKWDRAGGDAQFRVWVEPEELPTDGALLDVHAELTAVCRKEPVLVDHRFALTDEGAKAIKRRHDSAGEAER